MSTNAPNIPTISKNTLDLVLPTLVIVLIVLFTGYMVYLLIVSGFQKNPSVQSLVSGTGAASLPGNSTTTIPQVICNPGQCPTNIQSGFKRCPFNDIAIAANPLTEVCNSRYICENPLTPYALQSDGSTLLSGVCETGVECPCLTVSQCPEYILSVFTTSNGNPYESSDGQRLVFPQASTYVTFNGGNVTTDPPIQFNNPSTTFCTAPPAWLPLSSPGCNFVSLANSESITYDEILLCMGQAKGCSGLLGNPCLQGTLAFVSNNSEGITQSNILTNQLGCVRGEPCPCGQAAIFDISYGGIICRSLM